MNSKAQTGSSVDASARKADACVMVIFGASGDLTKRKLIPALLNLAAAKLLPEQFAIIGYASNDFTTETFRAQLTEDIKQFASCPVTPEMWDWFLKRIYYLKGDFQNPEGYKTLKAKILEVEKTHHIPGNRFYYLAVAPRFFGEVVRQLGAAGLVEESKDHWARV